MSTLIYRHQNGGVMHEHSLNIEAFRKLPKFKNVSASWLLDLKNFKVASLESGDSNVREDLAKVRASDSLPRDIFERPLPFMVPAGHPLSWWLPEVEDFAKRHLKVNAPLAVPEDLLTQKLIPVYVPDMLNASKVLKLLRKLKCEVLFESKEVEERFALKRPPKPGLYLIADSPQPDQDTMGILPSELFGRKKLYIDPWVYCFAVALYSQVKQGENFALDNVTLFPPEAKSQVSFLGASQFGSGIAFTLQSNVILPPSGARVAMFIPLKK